MKNYIIICLGFILLTFESVADFSMPYGSAGPLPSPFPSQYYQPNPATNMTYQQKIAINQIFISAQRAFRQNHLACSSRGTCLNLDLTSLANFIYRNPTHPARLYIQNVYNAIRTDARYQKFTTQWVIFQNLSAQRQLDYRRGLRFIPIQPQTVRMPYGTTWVSTPAQFNRDDVLTRLLQDIDHHHRNCNEYVTCLAGDQQIIRSLYSRLAVTDPVRNFLASLSQIIARLSTQKVFNTFLYLQLYNPVSLNWYDDMQKHRAKETASYGYIQWQQIERSSPATTWRTARITNGQPITQNDAFRANMQGLRSNVQTQKQSIGQWWRANKDLFKGWF